MFDEVRLGEREELIAAGAEPYPHGFAPTHTLAGLREAADDLVRPDAGPDAGSDGTPNIPTVRVAGRITSVREMGKTKFCDVADLDGRVQIYLKKKTIGEEAWARTKLLDLGDIVGVEGTMMTTRSGELTVQANALSVLAKAVVPIPLGKEKDGKKWHALADPDIVYRERYLDWITSKESRARFVKRARIIAEIRRRMTDWGFLEVEPPVLEHLYGGGEADPFVTRARALGDEEMYLRISLEIPLKKFIVGGFPKVFALGPTFRNEGIDRSHHPEFSLMEWYEAYTDYEDQMRRVEELVAGVALAVNGTTKVSFGADATDLAPPWRRVTLADAVKDATGIDVESASAEDLRAACAERGVEETSLPTSWGEGVTGLFEAACEPELVDPVFVVDYPREVSPLTKRKRLPAGGLSERWVERFEPYMFRMEMGNAYTELTDPVEQLERLESQARTARGVPVDYDFAKAIGCGMPPTGGVGLGVDRLVMILTGAASVRDVIAFPLMRSVKPATPGRADHDEKD